MHGASQMLTNACELQGADALNEHLRLLCSNSGCRADLPAAGLLAVPASHHAGPRKVRHLLHDRLWAGHGFFCHAQGVEGAVAAYDDKGAAALQHRYEVGTCCC